MGLKIIGAVVVVLVVLFGVYLIGKSDGNGSANANYLDKTVQQDGTKTSGTKPSTKNVNKDKDKNSDDKSAVSNDDDDDDDDSMSRDDDDDDDDVKLIDFVLDDGRTLGPRGSAVDSKLGIKRDDSTGTVGAAKTVTWKVPSNEVLLAWGSVITDHDNSKLSRSGGVMHIYKPGESVNFTYKDGQRLVVPAPIVDGKANTRAAYSKYCATMIWHVYSVPPYSMSEVVGNVPSGWDLTCNGNIKMDGREVLGKGRDKPVAIK